VTNDYQKMSLSSEEVPVSVGAKGVTANTGTVRASGQTLTREGD